MTRTDLKPYCFEIGTKDKTYYVACKSDQDLYSWMDEIYNVSSGHALERIHWMSNELWLTMFNNKAITRRSFWTDQLCTWSSCWLWSHFWRIQCKYDDPKGSRRGINLLIWQTTYRVYPTNGRNYWKDQLLLPKMLRRILKLCWMYWSSTLNKRNGKKKKNRNRRTIITHQSLHHRRNLIQCHIDHLPVQHQLLLHSHLSHQGDLNGTCKIWWMTCLSAATHKTLDSHRLLDLRRAIPMTRCTL